MEAMKANDRTRVENLKKILMQSKNPRMKTLVTRLFQNEFPLPTPSKINADQEAVALAECTPKSAKVGWKTPMYNRIPSASVILKSAGKMYEHGIFAHAPASHRYSLGGKWTKLSGDCGVADGKYGAVVFVIKGDGKELWRSKLTKHNQVRHYDIKLNNVKSLELIVEDDGDKSSDWGLWLEPVLER